MQKVVQADMNVVNEVERTKWKRLGQTVLKYWRLYVLLIPMLIFLFCFKYMPIGGILSGFRYGMTGEVNIESEWCGLRWAEIIFIGSSADEFWRSFRNTFVTSMYGLIFGFPIPIILALLFSEIKNDKYRSILQVCCYLPHFVSVVVVTQIIGIWCIGHNDREAFPGGFLYKLFREWQLFDTTETIYTNSLLASPKFFRPIYQISGIWEGAGYGSIVYFAAVLAISPTSYEAARIDGATKLQQIRYITFPGMAPTLTIMLIMRIGQILNIGYEKIILLQSYSGSDTCYETSDVVSSFVYRMAGKGSLEGESTLKVEQIGIVADLFNSIIAMFLVLGSNAISRRVSNTSLF
jgi:putative aldouronate transport system permease protein